jgi:hypothetical protein
MQPTEPRIRPSGRPIRHFQPGQLGLLVEFDAKLTPDDAIRRLDQSRLVAGNDSLRKALGRPPRRVIPFPARGEARAFAIAFVDVDGDDANLMRVVDDLAAPLRTPEQNEATITAVAPNWLLTCAHHIGALGGPGTRPIADSPAPDAWRWKLPADMQRAIDEGGGKRPVEVAILDTAPCAHDLERAYHRWHESHPLIAGLLGPAGKLRLSHASAAELIAMGGYDLDSHAYVMADHGLFAASVIHAIAPRADLHLIEVLNQYGVGTLESVAAGFARLTRRDSDAPLVVNCSLVLNMPQPEQLESRAAKQLNWPSLRADTIHLMSRMLERVCDRIRVDDVLIVAAAGNDAENGSVPEARYPAAFDSVIGVGALRRDLATPAEYSNLSDRPVKTGIATFGGAPLLAGVDPAEGVLGAYTGALPDGADNTDGWARWSGTSFATPVISGVLAALLGAGNDSSDAIALIDQQMGAATAIGRTFPATQS